MSNSHCNRARLRNDCTSPRWGFNIGVRAIDYTGHVPLAAIVHSQVAPPSVVFTSKLLVADVIPLSRCNKSHPVELHVICRFSTRYSCSDADCRTPAIGMDDQVFPPLLVASNRVSASSTSQPRSAWMNDDCREN